MGITSHQEPHTKQHVSYFLRNMKKIFLGGRTGHDIQWCSAYCNKKASGGDELLRMGNSSYSQQGKKNRKIMKILPNL